MDYKTSLVLSKTYGIVSVAFVCFSIGLGLSIPFPFYGLAIFLSIVSSLIGMFIICMQHPTQKLICLSVFGLGMGYLAGNYCLGHGLEASDIVFCGLATLFTFLSATFAAYFSREMMFVYVLTLAFISISYLPLVLFYMFWGGQTMLLTIVTIGVVASIVTLMIDTQKIIREIERGVDRPFELAFIIFSDAVSLFLDIARLLIVSKRSKKDDDD